MNGRIRTHKPELYIHEELNRLEQDFPHLKPMLVFLGLMTHSDREGRFAWRPKQLKLAILPFVEFDFNATLPLQMTQFLLLSRPPLRARRVGRQERRVGRRDSTRSGSA